MVCAARGKPAEGRNPSPLNVNAAKGVRACGADGKVARSLFAPQ